MKKQLTFNEDATNYDKYRPRYCEDLFNSIIEYSGIDATKQAIEIGIGTGQATEPILQTGCFVTAIELGDNLAEYSRNRFGGYDNFEIYNVAFEDYKVDNNSIDLIYSGTAFHWIPEEVGYKKTYDMLRSGGTIALFWNRPSVDNLDMHRDLQAIYAMISTMKAPIQDKQEAYNKIIESINNNGYMDLEFKLIHQMRNLNTEDYISLLNTYSDHILLQSGMKEQLYKEIREVINGYGGNIVIHDSIDLYLGKKP